MNLNKMNIRDVKLLNIPNLPNKEYHIVLHCSFEASYLFDSLYKDIILSPVSNEKQLFDLILEILMVKNFPAIKNQKHYLNYIINTEKHFDWLNQIIDFTSYHTPYIMSFNIYYYDEFSFKYLVDIDFQKEESEIRTFYSDIIKKVGIEQLLSNFSEYVLSYLEQYQFNNLLKTELITNRSVKI